MQVYRAQPKTHGQRQRASADRSLIRRALRVARSDAVLALVGVLIAIAALALAGVALTWLVFRDRYGVGFFEYLTEIVF